MTENVPLNSSIESLLRSAAARGSHRYTAPSLFELGNSMSPSPQEAEEESEALEAVREDHSQGHGTPTAEPDLGERFRAFVTRNRIY